MAVFDLLFLGTSAHDFSPRLEGDCKDRFDLDARRASCALLNGCYLIDCGPHCLDAMRIANVDPAQIRELFMTHFHSDHFNADNVNRLALAVRERTGKPLRVWVSEEASPSGLENVTIVHMKKLEPTLVDEDLSVTGLFANHDAGTFPQHFLFEKDGNCFLYATDGAWMLNATYNSLRKNHKKLSLFVVDATTGDRVGDFRVAEHNSIPMIRLMLPSLKTVKIVDSNTSIWMTHLAPSLHVSHEETCRIVEDMGVGVAYDGLHIHIGESL